MKKTLILLIAACFLASSAFAGKAENKLEEKKIKIETAWKAKMKFPKSKN